MGPLAGPLAPPSADGSPLASCASTTRRSRCGEGSSRSDEGVRSLVIRRILRRFFRPIDPHPTPPRPRRPGGGPGASPLAASFPSPRAGSSPPSEGAPRSSRRRSPTVATVTFRRSGQAGVSRRAPMSRGEVAPPARTSPSSSRTDAVTFDEATMPGAKPAALARAAAFSPGKGAVTLGKAAALPRAAAFSPDKAAALPRGAAFPDGKAAALPRAASFSLGEGAVTLEKAAALPRGAAFPDGKAAALPRGAGFGLGKAAALRRAAAFSRVTWTFPRVTGALPRETAAALARGAGVALVGAASPPLRRCSRSIASSSPCVAGTPPPPGTPIRRAAHPSWLRHAPPLAFGERLRCAKSRERGPSPPVVRPHDSAQPMPGRLVAEGDEGVRSTPRDHHSGRRRAKPDEGPEKSASHDSRSENHGSLILSAGIPQTCGDPVDRQKQGAIERVRDRLACPDEGTLAAQELDLHEAQRVDVGVA